MAFVDDDVYEELHKLLVLYNGSVDIIADLILSYSFIKIPEFLYKQLDIKFPRVRNHLIKEAKVKMLSKNVWNASLKKEVKLRVGFFLCNSIVSDKTIITMIALPYLVNSRHSDKEFWQSFLCDGLLWIFDLGTEECTFYEHMDNWPFFNKYKNHDLSWYQDFPKYRDNELSWYRDLMDTGGHVIRMEEIQFFGGRIVVSDKNYIQFCVPQFNHVRYEEWEEEIHEESGLRGPKPWDKSDVFTIEDNWWFFGIFFSLKILNNSKRNFFC